MRGGTLDEIEGYTAHYESESSHSSSYVSGNPSNGAVSVSVHCTLPPAPFIALSRSNPWSLPNLTLLRGMNLMTNEGERGHAKCEYNIYLIINIALFFLLKRAVTGLNDASSVPNCVTKGPDNRLDKIPESPPIPLLMFLNISIIIAYRVLF